jgi:hypothetical protein
MSGILIVPDALYDAIHEAITKAAKDNPEIEKDRDSLYRELLDVFNQFGYLPAFRIEKTHDQRNN